ncbi:MAG: methyltransferase [Planctomycetes bacterium]|nr:methyltransferase [Planctomycetota bacterium]
MVIAALRDHYGLEKRPVKVTEPYQMLGALDNDLMDAMGIDVVSITPRNTMFGFPNQNWQAFKLPWGQAVLVSEHFKTTQDSNGDLLIFPEGDTSVPPSGRMPTSGFFFDTIVRQAPILEDALDPADNQEEFGPVTQEDLDHFKAQADAASQSDRGVVATFGGTAFGDIALVPAPFLKHPRGIRDIAEWYMSTALRPEYVHAVFTHQCKMALENLEKIHAVVGNVIDAVFVCGTDFGTQTSQFCSVDTYEALYAPYYKQVNAWIHEHTTWKTFKHSCGAVEPLMSHFIDSGFDIINPVQCSATGMAPQQLKARYGKDLIFWGGGVDTQHVLPFGSPAEVAEQVRERLEIFGQQGGYVFNTIHNIQANTPVENIVAMIEAVQAVGR